MLSSSAPNALKLVFGSQILDFDRSQAEDLRSTLLDRSSLQWIVDAIRDLPQQWNTISDAIPVLQAYPGLEKLNALATWIRTGNFDSVPLPLDNVVLTPLVVTTHLVQYAKFLEMICPDDFQWDRLHETVKRTSEAIGFCTGQLSAGAIAAASTWTELQRLGTAAINTAMAIGAVVDAVDSNSWKSIVVSHGASASDVIPATLAKFPQVTRTYL